MGGITRPPGAIIPPPGAIIPGVRTPRKRLARSKKSHEPQSPCSMCANASSHTCLVCDLDVCESCRHIIDTQQAEDSFYCPASFDSFVQHSWD